MIRSRWEFDGDKIRLTVDVPANTTATVHVPTGDAEFVQVSGVDFAQAEGVRVLRRAPGGVVVEVGSGQYVFKGQR